MSQAETILKALGGWDNIDDIEACITRIRVDVEDDSLVDDAALKEAGAFGVHIPYHVTWAHELADAPENEPRYVSLSRIGELPDWIKAIDG